MILYDKIVRIYPTLNPADFYPVTGTIVLQNDGDGDYIKEWNHPVLSKPTQIQLDAVNE
jgi:hypothetical protein